MARREPAGVDAMMRVTGHLPLLRDGERDCPTCRERKLEPAPSPSERDS